MRGPHLIKSWATAQRTVALSSGEAELYAATKTVFQSLGVVSLLEDFAIRPTVTVYSDSTAAIGIASCDGLGRTRHIRVQRLWVQEQVRQEYIALRKVATHSNIADLMTTNLKADDVKRILAAMWFMQLAGRSARMPNLFGAVGVKDFWVK